MEADEYRLTERDAQNERITNSKYANNLLHYQYREPWKLA